MGFGLHLRKMRWDCSAAKSISTSISKGKKSEGKTNNKTFL